MKSLQRFLALSFSLATLLLGSCVEYESAGLTSGLGSTVSSSTGSRTSGQPTELTPLTKHDVALRFLTAYIRLDRNMALQFATPQAVSKLDWNLPHRGNIPYYDDKMLLQFNGGWARVFFQDVGGTYKIVDFEVHRRR
ncbi:MAG: hypothetical protein JNJ70_07295 [Verrucomicrobiales bacterium]|nr:hypothetical protein [Verrucomicrobiales bacterium]